MFQMTEELERAAEESREHKLPEPLNALERVSWNYWWSWAKDGAAVFRALDPDLWDECEQNPKELLNRISAFRLMQMATDPVYINRVAELAASFDKYMAEKRAWSPENGDGKITVSRPVAYFCAEYGVHNSLPLYSGGLGVLAGDHLKSASDLRLPLVAVGLLYHYGYFRQRLTLDGWQQELYGETRPDELPIRHVRNAEGEPLIIEVTMRGRSVRAQVWRVEVGRVELYLLDTNVPENDQTDRWVTGHLYGGDRETRVVQEMMLGIGGVRLLRELKIEPHVYHLNEGHSAFLTLELARELMEERGISFHEAVPLVRARCAFTTHTPVAVGNDEFTPALIEKCFGETYEQQLGLTHEEFLNLGRVREGAKDENFGLTPLAIRMCRSTNGVSRKHGEVTRLLWQEMWPEATSASEIPITHITNGVHTPTWAAPLIRTLFEKHVGADWQEQSADAECWKEGVARIPDEKLWGAHQLLKQKLVAFMRSHAYQSRKLRGEDSEFIESARTMFDPDALIIGFARRVAAYKRWNLLLSDPERIMRLIMDEERPIQFVFAGKAHPQDQGAKHILQQLAQWKYDSRIRRRAVFLEDYDQEIARQMVQSVDVWLNVPRRPLEASGTSGQKVAINGGLNLSILDGWWIEGYDNANGWAIDGLEVNEEVKEMDAEDAASLYRVLEEEVVPTYYDRDATGIPRRWVRMMRHSIETLVPLFNSDRMVEEYARRIYS